MIKVQQSAPKRSMRRPNFPIAGTMSPYGLYPMWAHPVLPGETVQDMTTKLRMLSMPIKHPMVGAWLETWLVYVKFTDIDPDLGQSFVTDGFDATAYTASADQARYFTKDGQVDWVRLCTERFHEAYFIHEDETPQTVDGVPMIKLNNVSFYQNMIFENDGGAAPTADTSDLYQHLQNWEMMNQMKMTELTYEKYLETFGVRARRERKGDPEILRFHRSWTTPTNIVNPVDGTPSSAWSWLEDVEMSKPKRFDEPGFLLMFGTVRPKFYQGNIAASLIGNLWGFSDWYPSYTLQDPTAGVRQISNTDPVFADVAAGGTNAMLMYDHRDLLSHGEQFVNNWDGPFALPVAKGLSTAAGAENPALRGEYPLAEDLDNIFADPAATGFYYEGMGAARISGHVTDTTT